MLTIFVEGIASFTNAGTENTENKDLQNYEDEESFNAASENYQKTANNNLPKEEPQSGTDSAHKQRELTIDSIRIYENDSLPISKKETPVVEVHISNTFAREEFRHNDVLTGKCKGLIVGLGLEGIGPYNCFNATLHGINQNHKKNKKCSPVK